MDGDFGIELYWLPLGAGGHSVRLNGKVFEWVAARIERRERGVVAGGAVGAIRPPAGGRAPGWRAGIVVAHRQPQAG